MKFEATQLSSAVRLALSLGAIATADSVTAVAQDATTPPPKGQALETIVVTGSNIRRVDIETASPVVTIDRAQIQASGKVNLGDLVQALPTIAGNAQNPAVNNGSNKTAIGSQGQAGVSLRGLGSVRTLLLLNGHRIPFQLQDLNVIPVSAVERIEVLNDGASSVYGSDAIAGVVNIITKTNYQGAEFGVDFGQADKDDGERKAAHLLIGQSTDKGSIMFGLQYDKQDPVFASNRKFSHNAQYIYNTGVNTAAGSSRTPGGRFFIPGSSVVAQALGCPVASNGTTSVTLSGNQLPTQTTPPKPGDFRCYSSATDGFNFQAIGNYDLLPNERTSVFVLGNYKLTDNVEAYAELMYHKMVAHAQFAPYPFDLGQNSIVIPANQYYNPFGVEFGENGSTDDIASRLSILGNRGLKIADTTELANVGLRGSFGTTSWNWDAHLSYGKNDQLQEQQNYINFGQIKDDFSCATAPGVGSCTPIDIFNLTDPTTQAILQSAKINPFLAYLYQMKEADASVNGTLFSLPAGDVQLAVGGSYRKEYVDYQVDPLLASTFTVNNGTASITCAGPGSLCTSPAQGGFNLKEAYAELLIPLLKDMPFVHSLNVDIGDRYSKYSDFGSTNNWKVALEYRPIEDLLLRATASKVFRAPTPTNIFAGPTADAPTAVDPCAGISGVSGNKACQGFNVPHQVFSQLTAYNMGAQFALQHGLGTGVGLLPENGKSYDYGFVYDPEWIPGLSINADYYRIVLNNLIVFGANTAQTILNQCFNTQDSVCGDIVRNKDGSIKFVVEAPFNSGTLVDEGFDIGGHYRLPTTEWGNFVVGLDGSYIQAYNISQGGFTQHLAGHYDKTYGNFARVRGLATLDWSMGPFMANWTTRYIGPITVGYANFALGPSGVGGDGLSNSDPYNPNPIGPVLHSGAVTYHNASFGYNIEPINTFVQIGVDNIFNKQPPLLYQTNVTNANTDVFTYDVVGRFYRASVTVKF
jgi:outer membrane receptor protein involved in Fe transport